MPDIEFTETRDGVPAITIPLRSGRLGVDGAMIVDWLDTALWALGNLREGRWDTAHGPDAVREIGHAINALDHRLAPRLEGLRAALIRLHKQAGGSVGDLASAMDVGRSTAQGRQDRTLAAPVSTWETWARSGGPQPPVPVRTEWSPPAPDLDRRFAVGDRVRMLHTLTATWIDEDLAAESQDGEAGARVRVKVKAGEIGRITVVRGYPTPFPYVVMFGDREIGVDEHRIERVAPDTADQPPAPAVPPFVVLNDQGTPRAYGPPPADSPEAAERAACTCGVGVSTLDTPHTDECAIEGGTDSPEGTP